MTSYRPARPERVTLNSVTEPATEIRALAKTVDGRLTAFGEDLVEVCKKNNIKQSLVAKFLDVTPAAISRRY